MNSIAHHFGPHANGRIVIAYLRRGFLQNSVRAENNPAFETIAPATATKITSSATAFLNARSSVICHRMMAPDN
jgi:hypothetical protein